MAGSIRNVNIGYPGAGRTLNCVKCAEATAHTLSGHPACALPGIVAPIAQLEAKVGGRFLPIGSSAAIAAKLTSAGSGSHGIVYGMYKGQRQFGHVFNAVNQNGVIRFLDGQTGKAASFAEFKVLSFMRIR